MVGQERQRQVRQRLQDAKRKKQQQHQMGMRAKEEEEELVVYDECGGGCFLSVERACDVTPLQVSFKGTSTSSTSPSSSTSAAAAPSPFSEEKSSDGGDGRDGSGGVVATTTTSSSSSSSFRTDVSRPMTDPLGCIELCWPLALGDGEDGDEDEWMDPGSKQAQGLANKRLEVTNICCCFVLVCHSPSPLTPLPLESPFIWVGFLAAGPLKFVPRTAPSKHVTP
jgi:hypothetical protein